MDIEEKAKQLLYPQILRDLVDIQTRAGVKEYGQTLTQNDAPLKDRVIHALQDMVDSVKYLLWLSDSPDLPFFGKKSPLYHGLSDADFYLSCAEHIARMCQILIERYPDLTLEDLQHKEGNSKQMVPFLLPVHLQDMSVSGVALVMARDLRHALQVASDGKFHSESMMKHLGFANSQAVGSGKKLENEPGVLAAWPS